MSEGIPYGNQEEAWSMFGEDIVDTPVEPQRREFSAEQARRLHQVAWAWHTQTNGELFIEPDDGDDLDVGLANTVLGLFSAAVEQITLVDADQYGAAGMGEAPPFGAVRVGLSDKEALDDVPRRVAEALALVLWGGRVVV